MFNQKIFSSSVILSYAEMFSLITHMFHKIILHPMSITGSILHKSFNFLHLDIQKEEMKKDPTSDV
jgi:hypothetical protein